MDHHRDRAGALPILRITTRNISKYRQAFDKGDSVSCSNFIADVAAGAALVSVTAGAEESRSPLLEEVIVTAQKRAQNVQDVPIAMQAFTAEQLQNARVGELTDIARMAPNLNVVVQNAMSQHIVIRGVGTNEFFGNAPSSVGLYMDEVTMNSSYMSTLGLFDMERIEVLRGPQNSLFGRNTTGGAVNYITRQPKVGGETEGYALLTYGRHNLAGGGGRGELADGQSVRGAPGRHLSQSRWHLEQPGQWRSALWRPGALLIACHGCLGAFREHARVLQRASCARQQRRSAAEGGRGDDATRRFESTTSRRRHRTSIGPTGRAPRTW